MTTNCRLREELEEARAELAELKAAQRLKARDLLGLYKQAQPIRVPFSDEQIKAMARAAHTEYYKTGKGWHNAIRAALAAGGLEPCPPPEYKPEDVALKSRAQELEVKIERQRSQLNKVRQTIERKNAEIADMRADRFSLEDERRALQKRNDNQKEQIIYLDGQISPLMCQVTNLRTELEAMKAERDIPKIERDTTEIDALRAKLARVSAKSARRRTAIKQLQKVCGGWRKIAEGRADRLREREVERDAARAEAEACDVARYAAEAELEKVKAEREAVPVKVRFGVSDEQVSTAAKQMFDGGARDVELARRIKTYLAALAAHAAHAVPPGVPSVEELAKVSWAAQAHHRTPAEQWGTTSEYSRQWHRDCATAIRDAVLAGVGQQSDHYVKQIEERLEETSKELRYFIRTCEMYYNAVYGEDSSRPCDGMADIKAQEAIKMLLDQHKKMSDLAYGLERENKNLRSDLSKLKAPSENIRFAVNANEVLDECGGDTNVNDLESYMEYLINQVVLPTPAPTDAQVDALAWVLRNAVNPAGADEMPSEGCFTMARAAFEYFAAMPVWTGPTREQAKEKWLNLTESHLIPIAHDKFRDWLLPLLPSAKDGE